MFANLFVPAGALFLMTVDLSLFSMFIALQWPYLGAFIRSGNAGVGFRLVRTKLGEWSTWKELISFGLMATVLMILLAFVVAPSLAYIGFLGVSLLKGRQLWQRWSRQ